MNPIYDPKNRDEALVKVYEECSEVIQCAAKIQRFGWHKGDPTLPEEERETNEQALLRELGDVELATVHLLAFVEPHPMPPFAGSAYVSLVREKQALLESNDRLWKANWELAGANRELMNSVQELKGVVEPATELVGLNHQLAEANRELKARVEELEITGALGGAITANKQLARRVEELEERTRRQEEAAGHLVKMCWHYSPCQVGSRGPQGVMGEVLSLLHPELHAWMNEHNDWHGASKRFFGEETEEDG